MIGYALLGATWLVLKSTGELRERAYTFSWWLLFATLGVLGAVSLATPFLKEDYWRRWFDMAERDLHLAGAAGRNRHYAVVAAQSCAAAGRTARSS